MIRSITRKELKEKLDHNVKMRLVDIRMRDSCEIEHIKGAMCVPFNELVESAGRMFNKNEEVIVYCGSNRCADSPAAAKLLETRGFKKVFEFDGGLEDWKGAKYPVETSRLK